MSAAAAQSSGCSRTGFVSIGAVALRPAESSGATRDLSGACPVEVRDPKDKELHAEEGSLET